MSAVHFTVRTLLPLFLFGFFITASNAYARADNASLCARYAADPDDPLSPEGVEGVWFERINVNLALPVCRKAVKAEPENNTLRYLLARTLYSQALAQGRPINAELLKRFEELLASEYWSVGMMTLGMVNDQELAQKITAGAAEQGHPLANYILANKLFDEEKFNEGLKFMQIAAEGGIAQAYTSTFVVIYNSMSGHFTSRPAEERDSVLEYLRTGMRLGDHVAGEYINRFGFQEDEYEYTSIDSSVSFNNGYDKGVALDARINTRRRHIWLGDIDSMSELGENLLTRDKDGDRQEAEHWLKAAKSNDPGALNTLFKLYITENPVRVDDARNVLALMREAVIPTSEDTQIPDGEPYYGESTIKALTTRLHYEGLDDSVRGSLRDIRALAQSGDSDWLDYAIEQMLYKVKAKSLSNRSYRVSVFPNSPSSPDSSFEFKLERIDGREDLSCMRQYFAAMSIDSEKELVEHGGNWHMDISGHVESGCEAIFPARVKLVCETAILCGRDDRDDYGRCGKHRSTEFLDLEAFKDSVPFSISTDLEISTRYGLSAKSECRVMALDDEKYHRKFESVEYPD